jgi:ubiquinone/menaquinone biosynthesis C-methylase UbiE
MAYGSHRLNNVLGGFIKRFRSRATDLPPVRAYEYWARTYDQRDNNALLYAEEQSTIPILNSMILDEKDIIDFGCGTGRQLSRCFGRNARSIVGIDFSREMLLRASGKTLPTENTLLLEASLESLPFRNSQFDVGIATLVLSHCRTLSIPIAEMSRVLRSGSRVLVSDWHPENDRRGWKRVFEVLSPDGTMNRYAAKSYHHSLSEFRSQFHDHGFVVEQVQEPVIDSSLEPIFRRTNMMKVFDQYAGCPVVVVFALRKL